MLQIRQWHLNLTCAFNAVMMITTKWLVGVLIRKLIVVDDASSSSRRLWEIVFLDNLSLYYVAGLSFAVTVAVSASAAIMNSLAFLRATLEARTLRHKVLKQAVAARGNTTGTDIGTDHHHETTEDATQQASSWMHKLKLVEDFQTYDEHYLLVNWLIVTLSFLLSFVFLWYAGLLALALFLGSVLSGKILENFRVNVHTVIQKNAEAVDARMLDVIKNGVKIHTMKMASYEDSELSSLEQTSDLPRIRDAILRAGRDFFKKLCVAVIPLVIVLVSWPSIRDANTTQDAMNIGFAVLVATLLLDEGHKSLVCLIFIHDRKVAAMEAKSAIHDFLNLLPSDNNKTSEEETTTGSETPPDDADDKDLEQQQQPHPKHDNIPSFTRDCRLDGPEIALTNIVLQYPGRFSPILDKFSQTFQRGKVHGLVGESGCGKSSVLKILADLLIPTKGTLTEWEGIKVAYVSQDQKLFARSIRENVVYGGSTTITTDNKVWEALRKANLEDWVLSLPNGLEEHLQGGENMVSGGQLQRLQLAHLFCTCQDADLVILDEVTSALDEYSRDWLIDQLGEFLKEKTAVIVTHHSEMLRICDAVHTMPSCSSQAAFQRASSVERRQSSSTTIGRRTSSVRRLSEQAATTALGLLEITEPKSGQ